jgi:hypothetical protein
MDTDWDRLLRRPDSVSNPGNLDDWFNRLASHLLNSCRLSVAGQAHRLVEIEFYYHGDGHADPFTHRDPLQLERGRWYFHRTRGVYRGGSFKGLDLTFGSGGAFGGVLLRGLETPEGKLVDGPSLLADHLLAITGSKSIAALDAAIAGRLAWDAGNPLRLEHTAGDGERPIYRSGRVGLSLKKASQEGEMASFVLRSYRYLTEPRRTAKGKALLVLALHAQGRDADAIHQLTGCPRGSIRRYLVDYEAGRQEADIASFFGIELTPRDLCRLHGTWYAHWGKPPTTTAG